MSGLLGTKVGMSRVSLADGTMVPVTLVYIEPNVVTQVKTQEKDGYNAIALGCGRKVDDIKAALKGNLSRKFRFVREVRVADPTQYQKDQELTVSTFDGVEAVSVQGISKGKGFAGVIKRHGFKGGPGSHGAKYAGGGGSIGTRKPRRTKPGKKMAGHMGADTVTIKRVPIIKVDTKHNIIALKGPVPGSINSLVKMWVSLGNSKSSKE